MPQNLTQIANSALIKLGATTIPSIQDSLREAAVARERIVPTIHRLLREHCWHFATKLVELAPLVSPGHIGNWAYAFQLPSDCMRLRLISTQDYELVGTRVLTNQDTLHLRYTQRMVDGTDSAVALPDDFADAVALFLAHEISPAITSSLLLREDLMQAAERRLAFARFNGAVEVPQSTTNDESWLNTRLVWGGDDRRLYPLDV